MQTSVSHLGQSLIPTKVVQFTMDTPHRRGSAPETMYTRMLGHVMGVPELAKMKPDDKPSAALIRANNLASLTAAMLLQVKPEAREDILVRTGGLNWTTQVLTLAKNYPGGLGITDAIRFSLALHFLLGILDDDGGRASVFATGYRAFAGIFKEAQLRRGGTLGVAPHTRQPGEVRGLGSLGYPGVPGTHPCLAFESDKDCKARTQKWDDWCRNNAGKVYDPRLLNKCLTPGWICDAKDPATGAGQECRGLNTGWIPPAPAVSGGYPAPPNVNAVDRAKVQWGACFVPGDLILTPDQRIDKKLTGVRAMFKNVFGRDPNNAEVDYYARTRWCVDERGLQGETLKARMLAVRQAIAERRIQVTTPEPVEGGPLTPGDFTYRDAGTDAAQGIQRAADAALDFLGKTADFVADIICKGFKAILGPQVGGVICDIITIITRVVSSIVGAVLNIVVSAIGAVVEFIKEMIAGRIEKAFVALLKGVGKMLFSISAPITVPMLMGRDKSMAEGFRELNEKADRVTTKNPLFPLMLILAVVNTVVAVSSGTILTPPFVAISGLILALAPMFAVFIAPPLKQIQALAQEKLDDIEAGIEKFFRFGLIIFQGAVSISGLMGTFREQLKNYFNKKRDVPGKTAVDKIKNILDRLTNGVKVITNAFSKFNFKDISAAAVPLLSVIPELLIAILPDSDKEMPSLTSWIDAAKAAGNTVEEQEVNMRKGAEELLKSLSPEAAGAVMRAQIAAEAARNPVHRAQAAKTAATIIGQQFQMKATYPEFIATFRAELLKV